jgi:hypothetical protein
MVKAKAQTHNLISFSVAKIGPCRIIRGPRCIARPRDLDSDPDRDSDWETEPEAEGSSEDETS